MAVHLAFEESTAFEPDRLAKIGFQNCCSADVQWCRYVDDILSFSHTLCSRCLSVFFSTLYSEKLSEVYSSDLESGKPFTWLLFEFHIHGPHLAWTLKNSNKGYLFGSPGQILGPSIVAWPGCLPMHFKQLRGLLLNKLFTSWSALLSPTATAIVLLELLLELLRLGYPVSLLRSLVHSIPKWPAVILARRVFRAFHRTLLDVQGTTMLKGRSTAVSRGSGTTGGYGHACFGRDLGREPEASRARVPLKHHKTGKSKQGSYRRSSSSSSSSSQERRVRQLARAQQRLLREDPDYQEFVRTRYEAEEEKKFKRQGELLAGVVWEKFTQSLASSAQPGPIPLPPAGGTACEPLGSQAAFSPEQLAQLKSLVSSLLPTPEPWVDLKPTVSAILAELLPGARSSVDRPVAR